MSDAGDKGKRVDLSGSLAGHYVRIDLDQLDCGVFEDLESGKFAKIIDVLERLIVGGDLPHGRDRAGFRRLKPAQLKELCELLPALVDIPKPA